MDIIHKALDSYLDYKVREFITFTSEKTDIHYSHLIQLWNLYRDTLPSRVEETNSQTCLYIFKKGNRIHQQCSSKPKEGKDYCCKHFKDVADIITIDNPLLSDSSDDEEEVHKDEEEDVEFYETILNELNIDIQDDDE